MSAGEVVQQPIGVHRSIPLGSITVSPTNPRKHFDQAKLDELAESILRHGVLQPVLVRPIRRGITEDVVGYELVAGERRFRASRQAALSDIPAIVRELDDKSALEVQVIENLQRDDLHPLEEAEGYQALLRDHGYDADTLAAKIGKSRSYVYGRIKLTECCAEVKQQLLDGKISHSIALLIARLPEADIQKQALEMALDDDLSYRDAKAAIESEFMLRLAGVPWKLDDADLVPDAGACASCQFRTGNQVELFGEVAKGADACTKPSCFSAKHNALWERTKADAKDRGIRVLSDSDSARAFEAHGGLKHSGPFVDATEPCYEDSKRRTYEKIVGKRIQPLLARSPKGKVVKLYDKSELAAALKVAGVTKAATSMARTDTYALQQRREAEKRKVDRAVEKAVIEAVMPRLAELPLNEATLRLIAIAMASERYYKLEDFFKRRGVKGLTRERREKVMGEVILGMSTGEMLAMIMESLITFSPTEMRREADKSLPGQLCDLVGVDWKGLEKGIRDAAAAKKKKKGAAA